jgi:hypothetical protein
LRTDKSLQDGVVQSPFKVITYKGPSWQRKEVRPQFVIYTEGKENAQKIVDILYKNFEKTLGLNVTPRYNEKVTSLIYFAQGQGKDKAKYSFLFEQPDMVYFKANVTGQKEDYRLKNPSKGTKRKAKKKKRKSKKKEEKLRNI